MNILAIDLGAWFTSVSGILITCGVVLLIIALVLFIVGSKKGKKSSNNVQATATGEEGATSSSTVATNVEATTTEQPVDVNANMNTVAPAGVDAPTTATVSPELVINSDEVSAVPSADANSVVPETVTVDPSVTAEVPVMPIPEPVVSTTEINPVPTISNEESLEMPNATNLDKTMVSVYGGANPADAIANVNVDEHKPIYGGNDPLEATQNLPKMDEHHEPYGGAMDEAKIAEAASQTVSPVPEVQAIPMPEVQPIPAVNTVSEEVKPIAVETPSVQPAATPIEIPTPNIEATATPVEIPTPSAEPTPVEIPTPAAQPTIAPEQVEEL